MVSDFRLNDHTGTIEKVGHYSRCEEHEATREEVLLWHRVRALEAILNERCPTVVQKLLEELEKTPEDVDQVELNPEDFAALRVYGRHRIEIETQPAMNRQRVLASFPLMRDGSPTCVWIAVSRDVPQGSVRTAVQ